MALSRRQSVTADGTVTAEKPASVTFRFTTIYKPLNHNEVELATEHKKVREAKYWYDVPVAALPVREEGWPEMPAYMNGRQYFLWWKNEFKTNDDPNKGELGMPVILDPLPERTDVKYVMGGKESRMWGA
jgi:hypothetical protein